MVLDKKTSLLTIMVLCCFLNIVSAQDSILSLFLALIEHAVFIYLVFERKFFGAFLSYILFSSATLEVDSFVLQQGASGRYSFYEVPVFHGLLAEFEILYLCLSLLPYMKKLGPDSHYARKFYKWLVLFLYLGIFASIFTFIVDDNGIRSSGQYPRISILELLSYLYRFSIIIISIVFVYKFNKEKQISVFCQLLLISLIFSSIVGALIGFVGYYGTDLTMLSSLAVGLSPCILLFTEKDDYWSLSLISAILIILACFVYPSVIGSKWYLVVGAGVICAIYRYIGIKSVKPLYAVIVAALFVVPFLMNVVSNKIDEDSFIAYKLNQSLRTINIFGTRSMEEWSDNMGESPLFRFDELHNIFLEYVETPECILIGKGFGGTTRHHTSLLSWETKVGAFSKEQVQMGAYYEMHESLAQIFLRHSFWGVFFLFLFIYYFIKTIPYSPWSLVAILWIFLYWDYGRSFSIGMVSIALVLKCLDVRKNTVYLSNKYKKFKFKNQKYEN